MIGKIIKLEALSIKTVPNATDICFSFALIVEAIAAIALAPQIDVPEVIKSAIFLSTLNILPIINPAINATTIKIITK